MIWISMSRGWSWLHKPRRCWWQDLPNGRSNSPVVLCRWRWPGWRNRTWRTWQGGRFSAPSPSVPRMYQNRQLSPMGRMSLVGRLGHSHHPMVLLQHGIPPLLPSVLPEKPRWQECSRRVPEMDCPSSLGRCQRRSEILPWTILPLRT